MIYEELAQLHLAPQCGLKIVIGNYKQNRPTPKSVALTQVNRRIREESLSIIYRHLKVHVHINTAGALTRLRSKDWMKQAIYPAALASVATIRFYPTWRRACWAEIFNVQSHERVVYARAHGAEFVSV
jgi:hypothetical protein